MTTECSIAELQAAIAGELAPDREQRLCRHLEVCGACSATIEEMAGVKPLGEEAARLLVTDELDQAIPSREEWSEVDFTVEHLEPSDDPKVLGRLGGYDVLEIIGRGGMGVVLRGFDRELNRYIAIKVLAPHLAASSLAKKRFIREAQAAAAVVHPHVMAIHQVQPSGRLPFLVMPLVSGESLAQRLTREGRLELKETLRIGMQAAAGLAAAHEQGLVHRDVKPANILLEKGVERVVITDFGLARAADDVSMTRWGVIAGTPQYMSPEQAQGEPVDGRSDLFSLGCVLYEMATGVSPFRADSTLATMRRLIDDPPPALAALNPELPPWFIGIVERLLEKDPSRRFSSAKEVSELLEGCLAHLQQPNHAPLPAILSPLPPGEGQGVRAAVRPSSKPSKPRFRRVVIMVSLAAIGLFAVAIAATDPPDISGNWQGEGWGQVKLTQAAPGEYTGTYTDTVAKEKAPGKIDLKWSRIERRFNGTWREGEDRFGELSLRLVDKEIRGALTTDPNSEVNPGRLRLADLAWTRDDVAMQSAAAELAKGSGLLTGIEGLLKGGPPLTAAFRKRVFEVDGKLVDRLIPLKQRRSGVQAGAKFSAKWKEKEVPETKSQVAEISTETLTSLLNGSAAAPHVLVDDTKVVTSEYWREGLADSWNYLISFDDKLPQFFGTRSGMGAGFYGLRGAETDREIRMECQVDHPIGYPPGRIRSMLLFEGKAPNSGALAFLVPFRQRDNSPHYLVVVYEVRPETSQAPGKVPAKTAEAAPRLEFRLVAFGDNSRDSDMLRDPDNKQPLRVLRGALLDDSAIAGASVAKTEQGVVIDVAFTEAGGKQFAEVTRARPGKRLAIVFDGRVLSAPTIRSAITGGHAQITGKFTVAEAEAIAKALNFRTRAGRNAKPEREAKPIRPGCAEFDRMPWCQCFAGSQPENENALGKNHGSGNLPEAINPRLPPHERGLYLFLDLKKDTGDVGSNMYPVYKLFLVNTSGREQRFANYASRLDLIQEARDQVGQWRPVEYVPSEKDIRATRYDVVLPNDRMWMFTVPKYEGRFKTKLRFKLSRADQPPVYSDEFDGSVNPGQFGPLEDSAKPPLDAGPIVPAEKPEPQAAAPSPTAPAFGKAPGLKITGPAIGFTQAQVRAWVEKRLRTEYPHETFQPLEWGQPMLVAPHDWVTIPFKYIWSFGSKPSRFIREHRYYTFTRIGDFVRSDYVDGPAVEVNKLGETVREASAASPAFGPVVERTMNDARENPSDSTIDLDSGKLFAIPADLWPKPGEAPASKRQAGEAWLRTNGIDATATVFVPPTEKRSVQASQIGLGGWDLLALRADTADWDKITAAEIESRLANAKLQGQGPAPLSRDMLVSQGFPATFLFQTREGGVGVLQIVGFTEKPKAVTIRYKLLTRTTHQSKSSATRLEFRLERAENDKTSAVDEFPNPGNPANPIRLLKRTVLDESGIADASCDPSPAGLRYPNAATGPAVTVFFSETGVKKLAAMPFPVELRSIGSATLTSPKQWLYALWDGRLLGLVSYYPEDLPKRRAKILLMPPATPADAEKLVAALRQMAGRPPASVSGPSATQPATPAGAFKPIPPEAAKAMDELQATIAGPMGEAMTAQEALTAYERSLARLSNISYEALSTWWDESSPQQTRRIAPMQEDRWRFARRNGVWWFDSPGARFWGRPGEEKRRQPVDHQPVETVVAGKWWITAIKGPDQKATEIFVGVQPTESPFAIGGTSFLFLHGYVRGNHDQPYLPAVMRGGQVTLESDKTGKEPLVVVRSRNRNGLYRLWLDPAKGFSAVRLEVEKTQSDSFGTKTLAEEGIERSSLVVEAERWQNLGDVAVPTRIIETSKMIERKKQEESTREVTDLSNIRLESNKPGGPAPGLQTAIPDNAPVTFFDDHVRGLKFPADSDDARLAAALMPLHNEFIARGSSHEELEAAHCAIGPSEKTFQRLSVERLADWFLRPVLPALRHNLAQRRTEVEKELAHWDALASMKGKPAPDSVLETMNGKKVRLSELVVGKAAVISFWGYSCGPCRKEAPHLTSLYQKYKNRGLIILAINCFKDSREQAEKYVKETGLGVPVFLGGDQLARDYHASPVPATYFVDRQGTVVDYVFGFSPDMIGDFEAKIQEITEAKALSFRSQTGHNLKPAIDSKPVSASGPSTTQQAMPTNGFKPIPPDAAKVMDEMQAIMAGPMNEAMKRQDVAAQKEANQRYVAKQQELERLLAGTEAERPLAEAIARMKALKEAALAGDDKKRDAIAREMREEGPTLERLIRGKNGADYRTDADVNTVQDLLAEIQPDESVLFKETITSRNTGRDKLKTVRFMTPESAQAKKVTDLKNRSLSVKENRTDKRVEYEVTLPEPVAPGAEFSIIVTGSASGLVKRAQNTDVFECDMRPWPPLDSGTRRIERYLLPAGAQLLELPPQQVTSRDRDGRIELSIQRKMSGQDKEDAGQVVYLLRPQPERPKSP